MPQTILRFLRQYHRRFALVMVLPLLMTALTGIVMPMSHDLPEPLGGLVYQIHTGSWFSQKAYGVLNGLGLLTMVLSGLSMTPLFRNRSGRSAG
jgi:uncharacterized iron-regulated membrane protein